MKRIALILLLALATFRNLLVAGAALEASSQEAANPHPIAPLTFSGTFLGEHFEINGTARAVLAALEKKHGAKFRAATAAYGNDRNIPSSIADDLNGGVSAISPVLEKRGVNWPPLCYYNGYRWKTTQLNWISRLYWDLRVLGEINVQVRGEFCGFLGCYNDPYAILCNDNIYTLNLRLPVLVQYIGAITEYGPCRYNSKLHGMQAGGQLFDSEGFNVIVRRRFHFESDCLWGIRGV